jgi:hypothetical protein
MSIAIQIAGWPTTSAVSCDGYWTATLYSGAR